MEGIIPTLWVRYNSRIISWFLWQNTKLRALLLALQEASRCPLSNIYNSIAVLSLQLRKLNAMNDLNLTFKWGSYKELESDYLTKNLEYKVAISPSLGYPLTVWTEKIVYCFPGWSVKVNRLQTWNISYSCLAGCWSGVVSVFYTN